MEFFCELTPNSMKAELREGVENIKDYHLKLGDKFRIVPEERGYSQEELAEIMVINHSTISKNENGKYEISIDNLVRFSIFLDY